MKQVHGTVSMEAFGTPTFHEIGEAFEGVIRKATAEAITIAFASDETHAFLPAEYGDRSDGCCGPPVENPLTVYFKVALGRGAGKDDDPVFATDLQTMLSSTIEACADDGSYMPGMVRVRDALRMLVAEMDAAIAAGEKHLEGDD